jgi:hypothetical protein
MKQGVPFVAFSLHSEDDNLHISTLDGSRVARGEVQESILSDLGMLNERGLEEASKMIGMYVLGLLQISHPDKFMHFPNLIVKKGIPPTKEELEKMNEKLRQLDSEEDH